MKQQSFNALLHLPASVQSLSISFASQAAKTLVGWNTCAMISHYRDNVDLARCNCRNDNLAPPKCSAQIMHDCYHKAI